MRGAVVLAIDGDLQSGCSFAVFHSPPSYSRWQGLERSFLDASRSAPTGDTKRR